MYEVNPGNVCGMFVVVTGFVGLAVDLYEAVVLFTFGETPWVTVTDLSVVDSVTYFELTVIFSNVFFSSFVVCFSVVVSSGVVCFLRN